MAEIAFTITENEKGFHLSAIISEEKTDSELINQLTQILAPVMLSAANKEIVKIFKKHDEVKNG